MSWTLNFNETLQIIELNFTGESPDDAFREAAVKQISLVKEKGTTRLLIDVSKLEVNNSASLDVYQIVDQIYEASGLQMRIAIAKPELPDSMEIVQFYETLCLNRGYRVKEFDERKAAIDWLLERKLAKNGLQGTSIL